MRLSLAALALRVTASFGFADWKPAAAPLMTKWGKEVKPDNAWKEYPRPQLVRKDWLNLNGLWNYAITTLGAEKPSKWDGEILVPFAIESALSGVGKHFDKFTYRRTFDVPADWKGKRVFLCVGAADWRTTAWLDSSNSWISA